MRPASREPDPLPPAAGIDLGTAVDIDLDQPRPPTAAPGSPPRPRRASRIALLAAFALAAGLPQAAPRMLSEGRPVPLPSYCTGNPIPGGRLNIIQGDNFIILDATTNTIVNSGRCPRGTGKLPRQYGN